MTARACQCGHMEGDHKSNRSHPTPKFGVCLATGCDCKDFAAREPSEAADAPEFPCDSFKAAARHLRRPFTPAAVRFKVQATWPKDNPTGGLIVAYIDARLATERLNLVVPHLWHDAYRAVSGGQMWCDLTIDGITRSDVGEGQGKALVSDSFKRAGVRFGIGVSLYAIPKMMLDVQSGAMKQKRTKDGLSLVLTPRGETICRDSYTAWLDHHGRQAFGEPLDHGDVLDAQGDHETDTPVTPEGVNPETGEVMEWVTQVKALVRAHKVTTKELRILLRGAGVEVGEAASPVPLVDALTKEQAALMLDFLSQRVNGQPRATPEPEKAAA